MTSLRLSNLVLMGGVAAAIGATSGALVDTRPLRWGRDGDWRERPPWTEELAASAIRRHDAFETARRNRLAWDPDYLAENEAIYLRPIDETVAGDMLPAPLESHRGQMHQGASSQEVALDVDPQQAQFGPVVKIGEDQQRLADAGPRIVEFPRLSQDGG